VERVETQDGLLSGEAQFAFKVKTRNGWQTRRMSMSALSSNIESMSVCYRATYDDNLVLKFPSSPITDFDYYLECVKKETRIAGRARFWG